MRDEIITEIWIVVRWNTWNPKKHPMEFEVKEDANTVWSRPYPVQKVCGEMLKKEVEWLVLIGVLEVANDSEWVSLSFAQPKPKTNQVSL